MTAGPEQTRKRILDAACDEFAEHGFGGARVARIADAAGANKERVYHYFGNKEQLFDAVLDDATERIENAEPFAADDIGGYVAAMLDFHAAQPNLIRLLLAEAAHRHRPHPPTRDARRRDHYATRIAAIGAAQRSGGIRADVDPRVVLYAVLALVATAPALPRLSELILAGAQAEPDERWRDTLGPELAEFVRHTLTG